MNNEAIGIFDSGVGGLSVVKEIHQHLPNENLIYIADNLYAPYGERKLATIEQRSIAVCDLLIKKRVKAIVIACNTATAVAVDKLREIYSLPIIAIEPAIKTAVSLSKNHHIGLLATKGTINSERYKALINTHAAKSNIYSTIGIGLVELIEHPEFSTEQITQTIIKLLVPLKEKQIDSLILGCTHYPLISHLIQDVVGESVQLIDTGKAVVKQLDKRLIEKDLKRGKTDAVTYQFITSGKNKTLKKMVQSYLDLENVELIFGVNK